MHMYNQETGVQLVDPEECYPTGSDLLPWILWLIVHIVIVPLLSR